jgi:hypothetical protein
MLGEPQNKTDKTAARSREAPSRIMQDKTGVPSRVGWVDLRSPHFSPIPQSLIPNPRSFKSSDRFSQPVEIGDQTDSDISFTTNTKSVTRCKDYTCFL